MSTLENLKIAYNHEIAAMNNYNRWAAEAQDPAIKEMFKQFAKNESWHAAAIKEKIEQFEAENRTE